MNKYFTFRSIFILLFLFNLACNKKIVEGNYIEEKKGFVLVEAENFHSQELDQVRKWYRIDSQQTSSIQPDIDVNHSSTASGNAYLEILPDTRTNHDEKLIVGENFSNEPGKIAILNYKVNFQTTGKYYVWVRAFSTGTEDNGIHVGLDGKWVESGQRMQWCEDKNKWAWASKQRTEEIHCGVEKLIYLNIETKGVHTISFSMREDGFEFDQWAMSQVYDISNRVLPSESYQLSAIEDYENLSVPNFVAPYIDKNRKAIAIDAGKFKDQYAAATYLFNGKNGMYQLQLHTLAELDGESKYRIAINGELLKDTKTNPQIFGKGIADYAPVIHVWKNVALKNGDEIRVEFSSETNGKIPEGDITAYSRGRFTSIQFISLDQ